MTTQFLTRLNVSDIENIPKDHITRQITNLAEVATTTGLSCAELHDVITCITTVHLNRKVFESLVYCLIPNEVVSPEIIEKVMIWILTERTNNVKEVECLLYWILCLLDYQLAPKNVVNEFYGLLWPLLEQYPSVICHLLYTLTQPEDVVLWRVGILQSHLATQDSSRHICAVLNRFKELNSKFANVVVPTHQKSEKIFQHKSSSYRKIRENLGGQLSSSARHSASIVVPRIKKTTGPRQNGLLPRVQYLDFDFEPSKLTQIYIHDIKNGSQLAKNFQKIKLPSQTLSLLGDTMGTHVLIFSPKDVQEQFLWNLRTVLEQNLIYRQKVVAQEVEALLNKVIELHWMYQQGLVAVSSVLSLFLQSWDGHCFKSQIYKLIEWFAFKSVEELNRFLLRPLYTLFVSSDSNGMCDILVSLSNLIMNLYWTIERHEQNFLFLYKENTLCSREDLLPVIRSLTKFMAELIKMGLYIRPCNNQILLVAIAFYERISYFERIHDVSWWTILPSNIVYHCLFSFNAQLMNQICLLFTNYNSVARLPVAQSTHKIEEKVRRLQNCYHDLYNILWSARAFVDRTDGHIFRGLSVEDEGVWREYVNLNNSLSMEKHIMFAPYRMLSEHECNQSLPVTKEAMLDIMRNHTPHLTKFIELLSNKFDEVADDEFEYD
ncbi:hypothetical protein V9T40_006364 [Parthenolecanium corni]|uniref:Centromere protein I n=1 Tax=Parthenolecanium corni TaxID=536013 RepID=A0AAN9Y5G6_9HEMI